MKAKIAIVFILMVILAAGCAGIEPVTPVAVDLATLPPVPTESSETRPIPQPTLRMPEVLSQGKLACTPAGKFIKCSDDVLMITFEYPPAWGEIESVLRTGGYSGYAYDYYFGGQTIAESEPLVAGGRSRDFSEGRGGMSTDFGGYDDSGGQTIGPCDPSRQSLFPICEIPSPNIAWMIRMPNADYICSSAPGYYTTPVFHIEINLPGNAQINGFVFEAPFMSEPFAQEVANELYPLLGLDASMAPSKCDTPDKAAFDARLAIILEKLTTRSADAETLGNIEALSHLANTITFR